MLVVALPVTTGRRVFLVLWVEACRYALRLTGDARESLFAVAHHLR